MINLNYKYPVITPAGALYESKNGATVETAKISSIIGILACIFYYILYIYLYATSFYFGHIDATNYTVSQAFQYSEKYGTIILLIIFIGLFQGLLATLNFYDTEDFRRIVVVCTTYVMLIIWLLFTFVAHAKHMKIHSFLAVIKMIFVVYVSYTIYSLYSNYYNQDGLLPLEIIVYLTMSLFLLCIVLGAVKCVVDYRFIYHVFACSEIICILMFGIFIGMLSQLPPLPNQSGLVCSLIV